MHVAAITGCFLFHVPVYMDCTFSTNWGVKLGSSSDRNPKQYMGGSGGIVGKGTVSVVRCFNWFCTSKFTSVRATADPSKSALMTAPEKESRWTQTSCSGSKPGCHLLARRRDQDHLGVQARCLQEHTSVSTFIRTMLSRVEFMLDVQAIDCDCDQGYMCLVMGGCLKQQV